MSTPYRTPGPFPRLAPPTPLRRLVWAWFRGVPKRIRLREQLRIRDAWIACGVPPIAAAIHAIGGVWPPTRNEIVAQLPPYLLTDDERAQREGPRPDEEPGS